MAANDYHVIVYQILAYLYAQLKKGEAVDEKYLRYDGEMFSIPHSYWLYIMKSLADEEYISGVRITDNTVIGLDKCMITPRGIGYICDDYTLEKARDYVAGRKDIPQFI